MYNVLLLHGFTSSGQCEIAQTLRKELEPMAKVISPDLPLSPVKAIEMIRDILNHQHIDLVVGSSCGAYDALFLANDFDIGVVLVNPQRDMVPFLTERLGERKYKSPRLDGKDSFTIDEDLIKVFSGLGEPKVDEEAQQRIFVFLGDEDPLRATRKEDFQHKEFFHGSHTMNAQQVREYLAPKCREVLQTIKAKENENGNGSMIPNRDTNKDRIVLKTIPLEEYISKCRNPEYFISFCKECRNYGKSWACPPLKDEDVDAQMRSKWATLVANHIVPQNPKAPLSEASAIMKPTRMITERILLEAEKVFPGRSFAFAGTCLYCPEGQCTRLKNEPCRHPELVRPSLEAVGFDISKTSEILGVELRWSKDEYVPEYLTLVSGFFHDGKPLKVEEFILREYLNCNKDTKKV